MKVLIETITSHRGYKFFENREEMDAYLGRHCGKITSYEILQEDDTASTNDILQSLAEECEVLENKLFYIPVCCFFCYRNLFFTNFVTFLMIFLKTCYIFMFKEIYKCKNVTNAVQNK